MYGEIDPGNRPPLKPRHAAGFTQTNDLTADAFLTMYLVGKMVNAGKTGRVRVTDA